MEEVRSAFKIVTGKPTVKRPLGSPRLRWEDNIRKIGRAVQQECRDRSRMPSSA